MAGDRERSLAAGCDEHWTKPIFDLSLFKDNIAKMISEGRPVSAAQGSGSRRPGEPTFKART